MIIKVLIDSKKNTIYGPAEEDNRLSQNAEDSS